MNKKIKKIIVMAACAALACVTLGGCAIKDEANNWLDQILCDHEYDEGEVTKEATCANKGEITYTCEECGKTKTEKTDKLPHVEKEIEVAATCQETGLTEGVKCVVCEEILVYPKVVAKIAHTEIITSAELAATCTTAGQTKGSHCGVCDEVLSVSEGVPATGHIDENIDGNCDNCSKAIYEAMDYTPTSLLLNTTTLNNTWFRIRIDESYNDDFYYCISTTASLGFDSFGDKYYGVCVPTKKGLESGKERCVYLFCRGGSAKVLDGIAFYYSEDGQYVDLCIKEGAVVTAIGWDEKEVSFTVSSDTDGVVEHVGYQSGYYKDDEFVYGNIITVLKPSENN